MNQKNTPSASPRRQLILGFVAANLVLIAIATTVWFNKPDTPPQIQGVLLQQGRPVLDFSLLDHNNRTFGNSELLGRWHLVSYGFTTCPDVCPTTLSALAQVSRMLEEQQRAPVSILFYSVDHRRDTVSQLASYVPFFDEDFLGLTHLDSSENPHLPFEQSLGIFARLTPVDEQVDGQFTAAYEVSHGVTLFLLNPEGQLQAIFEPGEDEHGAKVFQAEKIYSDYLQVRDYLDRQGVTPHNSLASLLP